MKNQTYLLPALFAVILFSASCKKKDDNQPAPKTKTQLITQATWKFSAAFVNGIDVTNLGVISACQKDNTLTFDAAGTGVIDEGATKCNGADPQTTPFTWNFANNETTLHVSAILFTNGSNDFTIVSLTETQLVGSQTINSQNVVVTFVH